eukprot:scaffold10382_cov65-Phaeocystis_antarctica.AAC.4
MHPINCSLIRSISTHKAPWPWLPCLPALGRWAGPHTRPRSARARIASRPCRWRTPCRISSDGSTRGPPPAAALLARPG